ncbi:hypothetical protein Pth03_81350 [Planotetraspora thailandica]|uniref:histidine kinase n=1 Tax=Planotetraspora thailandica TaxID=487172 RepID=A0A8J4DFW9_9ACTN|nr:HAMP domain-containing sensor histidine kinase [Planotetraspora thailandica]GII59746.1 hypothetical protein Pth03_81350 [Planotetraspora thailandica]
MKPPRRASWSPAQATASVRVRATVAATLVVALALGASALVLASALRGSLKASATTEAVRRAEAAVPYAAQVAGTLPSGAPAGSFTLSDPDVRLVPQTMGTAKHTAPAPVTCPKPSTTPGPTATGSLPVGTGSVACLASASASWAGAGDYALATLTVPGLKANGVTVQARSSLAPARNALDTLYRVLVPGVPGLLLLVALLTWVIVGRALAPVSAIRAQVAEITASDLHRRVPVPRSQDEIAALARTVNATLDRLERAVGQHKRFVADAAHELRSPIAILRTRLEVARDAAFARESLVEVERLQKLTADLLLLARLDAGEPLSAEEVDLGQLAAEEAARPRPFPGIRVTLHIAPDTLVHGSPQHLTRLIANLVDNAVRHAASSVQVSVSGESGFAVLEVRDDGPGIPAEHRQAVFSRFTRLDEARARDAGGSGLGLAIARDVALLHGGTLEVTDDGPGACLSARFPAITVVTSVEAVQAGRNA